jgi:hypothetical protein
MFRNDIPCICQTAVHKVINKFVLLFDSASYYTDNYAVLPNIFMHVQVQSATTTLDKSEIQ